MLKHYKALSLSVAATATVLSLLAAAPAQAQDEPFVITAQRAADMPMQRVSYRDLNLTFAPHRVVLIRRVDYAVRQVCQESDQLAVRTLASYTHYVACKNFAWNGARPQMAAAINRAWARAAPMRSG